MASHSSVGDAPTSSLVEKFINWTADNFIFIHPSLHFVQCASTPAGHDVFAKNEIPAGTKVLSCPFSMAITAPQSKDALVALFQGDGANPLRVIDQWSERQTVCIYMILHGIWTETKNRRDYARSLQFTDTPYNNVFFAARNRSLEGIKLVPGDNNEKSRMANRMAVLCAGAVNSRSRVRFGAYLVCMRWIATPATTLFLQARCRDHYLQAATHLSSRAFPSTILSNTPSNVSSKLSHAVLLPGIDSLNHKRAIPVSWVANVSEPTTSSTLDLLIHERVPAGMECFNNYGPKPNSELMLGYGFALPLNPDDTILLSLATSNTSQSSMVEIGRDAKNAEHLWKLVIYKISELGGDEGPVNDWEIELEAAETIMSLTEQRMERLPDVTGAGDIDVRQQVLEMIEYYLEGQKAILTSLIQWAQAKRISARDKALAEGIELVLDEDEDEDEE
ncbi:SET domain-containing protein [Rhizoctonia solani AG-1 IA]|uniref:SET domain-containing protein n=1 Tax=Thanatephorus cucumeris (strain AG1-IA) TaxID=983506 RepID=L8WWK4_THACA|nr:SET domain-containing protein [Rhizoctonia solani AG-1 IA]